MLWPAPGPRPALVAAAGLVAALGCGRPDTPDDAHAATEAARWCDALPRPANAALDRAESATPWFDVYVADRGVFAIVEANQFQETISYLILGAERALLFDTGLGMAPIRPVVERLTPLPVVVLNSHTHYNHVGGNAEFDDVLTLDLPYTRANQAGFAHAELAGEVAAESFCHGPPPGLDTAAFQTPAWGASRRVAGGDTIDLGGRVLEILHVPGHTPDAIALLDRGAGLLWTGDTYYDATIWLYVPETDLDAYDASMTRLAALAPTLRRLLPAHNTAGADPARLGQALAAIRSVRSGVADGETLSDGRVVFTFSGFSILTSSPLLQGKQGDRSQGGSGLTTWPPE